ncbi:MAG: nickel pincer cofactor biosynthesis protein LarB [Clostridiales bacterium]|nr:nickel pincer cofactor biosynthesis protein LarB [Clostridiales bacterium]
MDEAGLKNLLMGVRSGAVPIEDAAREIKKLPFADMGFAKVDHHRELRTGYPEVVFCPGKTVGQIKLIVEELLSEKDVNILATRASGEIYEAVLGVAPDAEYNELARTVVIRRKPGSGAGAGSNAGGDSGGGGASMGGGAGGDASMGGGAGGNSGIGASARTGARNGVSGGTGGNFGAGAGSGNGSGADVNAGAYVGTDAEKTICVVSAGTADLPVAEEAVVTAETLGNKVDRLYDVGVAGLHRLLSNADRLAKANVLIVVAGMEGALASVVGGLVDKPVIAVPTSVGYGASFGGLAALLAMLNSCAGGVGVVNIDNGFGAGYLASMINKMN